MMLNVSLVPFCFFAGRLFDFHVLDMIELGIEKFVSLSDIKVTVVVVLSVELDLFVS